jgi:predicted nucleic acid-binding protein
MRLIVADTSPLVYLILIDHIDILPQLFETVLVPDAVQEPPAHHGQAARRNRTPSKPMNVTLPARKLPTVI